LWKEVAALHLAACLSNPVKIYGLREEFAMVPGINGAALVILSALAVYFDLVRHKIPNFLTFPAMLLGLLYHALGGGWSGLRFALAGLLLGVALLLIPFAMGGMGGGDVKFLAAVGALQGAGFVLAAALLAALIGGAAALLSLLLRRRLWITLRRMILALLHRFFTFLAARLPLSSLHRLAQRLAPPPAERAGEKLYLPYGVPLALGALLTLSGLVQKYIPGLITWL
jgi:prepilin peptidase CpaA